MAPIVVSTFHIAWCLFSLFIEINCLGTADLFWSTYGWYCSFLDIDKSYYKSFVLPLYTMKLSQIYVLVHTETWKENFLCSYVSTALIRLYWKSALPSSLNNENASICKKWHSLISVPMLTNTLVTLWTAIVYIQVSNLYWWLMLLITPLNYQVWLLDKKPYSNTTGNHGPSVDSDMVARLMEDLVSILTTLAIYTGQFQRLILDLLCCSWVFNLSRGKSNATY